MYKHIAAAALATACLLPFIASAEAGQEAYQSAYQAAVAAHEKAVSHQNQWTTTNDALAAAEQAAAQGNYEKAVELAQRAEALAQLAVQQAKHQEEVWKQAVVR